MKQALVAGVDCSTQATKVLIIDARSGIVIAESRAPHTVSGSDGARETDPEVWYAALRRALTATGRSRDVAAIAVAAQQHGLVVLDAAGLPLRPAILWNDTRPVQQAASLVQAGGGATSWAREMGVVPVPALTVSKWAWLRRHEPSIAAAVRGVRLPHDFLTERLAGRAVTDRGDASGSGWWSTVTDEYVDAVLGLPEVDLDRRLLPDVLPPDEVAGEVSARAVRELGLRPGTIVGPGTGDNQAAALGLGIRPGEPVISLGTSGTVYSVMTSPTQDPSGLVAGFADASGGYLPLACTLNATQVVDRVAGWLGIDRDDAEPGGGVVALPYFDGERTPDLPFAAGSLLGLRHTTSPREILGAFYEGTVGSLLFALERLAELGSGIDPASPLTLVGGGARGRIWRETVSRLSGRAVQVPRAQELVALGAAVQAASLLLGEDPRATAARWQTQAGLTLEPTPIDQAALARMGAAREAMRSLNESPHMIGRTADPDPGPATGVDRHTGTSAR